MSSSASTYSIANDITSVDAVTSTTTEYANKLANATNVINKIIQQKLADIESLRDKLTRLSTDAQLLNDITLLSTICDSTYLTDSNDPSTTSASVIANAPLTSNTDAIANTNADATVDNDAITNATCC